MSASFHAGACGRVIQAWRAVYRLPLVLHPGQTVEIGKADPQWPGWVWCTTADEQTGWVPEGFLLRTEDGGYGVALYDYDSRELTVQPGELLVLEVYESGWYWAVNPQGDSGWVPETHVEYRAETAESTLSSENRGGQSASPTART